MTPARAARNEMLAIDDVLEILSLPLLGVIPESQEILKASNTGSPVTISNPVSPPARAYRDAARRLNGETVTMTIPAPKRRLFGVLFWREGRMNLLGFFRRRGTAPVARERLQLSAGA